MKTVGIIAEYNPFHSGHLYHIQMAKKQTGAAFCVAAISGDFVQRGGPALYDKYLRTRMALICGADLVVEIPSLFATGSAEDFAACSVALLSGLGAVDFLCFGSEEGDTAPILHAASLLTEESPLFSARIKEELRRGASWPQARNTALLAMVREDEAGQAGNRKADWNRLLGSPNNLLGIEYCKSILRQKSHLIPVTIKREGSGYHEQNVEDGRQASASAIRAILEDPYFSWQETAQEKNRDISRLLPHIPEAILPLYREGRPLCADDFSLALHLALLALDREGTDFSLYEGVSAELAGRLKGCLLDYCGWEGRIAQLKTRQYTYTRISRSLLHLLLGMTKEDAARARKAGFAPYARVLGFRREAAPLLSAVKKRSAIPLVTKMADSGRILEGQALAMLRQDIYTSHLRQGAEAIRYKTPVRNEYNHPICIV